MTPPRYFLARETFLCPTEFHWVLLDLKRDKYLAVHRRHFNRLGPSIDGWSTTYAVSPSDPPDTTRDTHALALELIDRGLLTKSPDMGKPCEPQPIEAPRESLDSRRSCQRTAACALYAPAFLLATARADYALRRRSLADVVQAIAHRKKQARRPANGLPGHTLERLTLIFNRLRPWYPRNYLCLYDALALIEFLALLGVFPTWVFGVTTDPFHAHCWVQHGSLLMNEPIERASTYVPILAV